MHVKIKLLSLFESPTRQNCNVICGGIPGGMNVTAVVELLLPLLARVLQSHHHHQQSMGLASSQPELEGEAPGQDYREGGHTQYCLASPSTQFYIYIYLYCIYLYNI